MESLFTKVSKSAEEAWSTIPLDVWSDVASYLEPIDILSLGRASKEMHGVMMYGEIWLNKLTVLMLQYPVLSQLEQATGEIPYIWYKRCQSAVGGGQRHAARHFRGESPYLELHGSIDGTTFTPFHNRLQFPVENGVIVELIQLLHKKIPSPRDACVDALEYFNIPDGVELDGTFRNIVARIKKMRARATLDNLRQFGLRCWASVICRVPAVLESPAPPWPRLLPPLPPLPPLLPLRLSPPRPTAIQR